MSAHVLSGSATTLRTIGSFVMGGICAVLRVLSMMIMLLTAGAFDATFPVREMEAVMTTLREHIETMLDMSRIANWRRSRGEMVMAGHAEAAARFAERKAREILRLLYS